MEYEIHIHDMENLDEPLILHYAEKGSIAVSWLGGDDLTQPIVPSVCRFSLETLDGTDGKYDEYFTSNEKRYRVTKVIHTTQEIVGRWFLLPETYEEPYLNPTFYTKFEAVDGLGLLHGKELPPDFYSKEMSVIEIISECLQLTEIDFDIFLSPAIENVLHKDWKDIILPTKYYIDEDKYASAYEFLEDLVFSMRCQLFQCEGRWYIEGVNKRHLPVVKFWQYDIFGTYKGVVDITKNIKQTRHVLEASVRMLPAVGKVVVTQEAPELKFPEALYRDEGEWLVPVGVDGSFFPREWNFQPNFNPKFYPPDNFLELPGNRVPGIDYHRDYFIELKERPYIRKDTRVRINFAVQVIDKGVTGSTGNVPPLQAAYNDGEFIDPIVYRVTHNGSVIFYNENTQEFDPARLSLDERGAGEVELYFISQADGFLNIELFEPKKLSFAAPYIRVTNLSIENINQRRNEVVTLVVNEKSSQVSEVDLPISDNILANSKSWQLEKLKEFDASKEQVIEVPILYKQSINGRNYSIVSVEGAVLIEQYREAVYWYGLGLKVFVAEVVYNLNGGSEMAIDTGGSSYGNNNFYVKVRPYKQPVTNRPDWVKWADAVYGLEYKSYAEIVADIEKRLYQVPRLCLEGSIDAPYKYNDLIEFPWKNKDRLFSFSNLDWDTDECEVSFILNEAIYGGFNTKELPPIVYAGPDFTFSAGSFIYVIFATVSAQSGNIQSILWEQVSGDTVALISNPSVVNPYISELTGDNYTFRLTATDSNGNSASDEFQFIRTVGHVLSLTTPVVKVWQQQSYVYKETRAKLVITEEIPAGTSILISFTAKMIIVGDVANNGGIGIVGVSKKGSAAMQLMSQGTLFHYDKNEYEASQSVNYTPGDDIELVLYSAIMKTSSLDVSQRLEVVDATFQNTNNLEVTGFPVYIEQQHVR